ncbi:MAG: hypothetical protein NW224_23230 [Leptolyngbyaceae cyanobacterium bins.302]|nr:hypothetical protein [Leptolyngbyaceae cyanobacterium bins.302]
MLQSNHLSLESLHQAASSVTTEARPSGQRSQNQVGSARSLEALRESLPANLSSNKRAIISRLIDLYEQGAVG